MNMEVKQVIVVRKDLNMRKGKLAAQVAHASLKVILDRMHKYDDKYKHPLSKFHQYVLEVYDGSALDIWLSGDFTKIVVGVDSEKELMDLYVKTQSFLLIPYALIQDAGKTEFKEPTYTALAIGPAKEEEINKLTGDLPLL